MIIKYSKASLADAVKPGIAAVVASEYDNMVNEVIEEAQVELERKIRKGFAAALETTIQAMTDEWGKDVNLKVVVDLRNNGESLK